MELIVDASYGGSYGGQQLMDVRAGISSTDFAFRARHPALSQSSVKEIS